MATGTRADRIKSSLIDGIARVDLRVRDIPTAVAFYIKVVGLEASEIGDTSASLSSPGAPVILRLDSAGVNSAADPRATGLFHTAFRFPTRPSLGDALARIVRAGLPVSAGDHLVSEALYIDDPDGNGVELYWDRPVEEWPPPSGDALIPMATLPVDLENLYAGRGESAPGEPAPRGTDIGHVHLQVSDVEETRRFYVEVLGLDLTARLGGSAAFLSSKGYHHNIGANSWRSHGGRAAPPNRAGLAKVVFAVSDAAELELLARRLRERESQENIAEKEITLLDPDGIELQFVLT
jgi:catechol 2,3-dioxygenase